MATPIGHALAGLAVYKLGGKPRAKENIGLALVCAFAATAPDIDVLPGLLIGRPAQFHAGITHSIGIALIFCTALSSATVWWLKVDFKKAFGLITVSYMTHLVLDFISPDARPPIGVPLFWPLSSETFISPWTPLLGVRHAASAATPTGEWVRTIFSLHNVAALAIEAAIIAPILVVGTFLRGRLSAKRISSSIEG